MTAADLTRFEANMIQFVRSELEIGLVFASLAVNSQTDEKWQRNRQNARKAYDTAQHFLDEHVAAEERRKHADLLDGLSELRNLLIGLGAKFDE